MSLFQAAPTCNSAIFKEEITPPTNQDCVIQILKLSTLTHF